MTTAGTWTEGTWTDGELLAFDLETTGVDRFSDVPVSYALVTFEGGQVTASDAGLVDPGREIPAGAVAVHGISTERARAEGRPLADSVDMMAGRLVDASARGVPIVGMKLDFDLTILDVQCRMAGGGLVERGFGAAVIDPLVIDRHFDRYRKGRRTLGDLCAEYGVDLSQAHDAAADAKATVDVLFALCHRYPEIAALDPAALHRSQVDWHREWATSYDEWRQSRGMRPLDRRELDWPIASDDSVAAPAF
jgi:DNA polymerase-3 subunit epsilon